MEAAWESMDVLRIRGKGYGGVIMISPEGYYGFAHNTPRMAFAFADEDGTTQAQIAIG
ncbi:isoaspartyl peptidase/L-asparaginase [Pseudodesulfovibrio sp. zrk46]|uniref:isoaspartyl peptidase/L-asparaginase n=1 Tax=Pseudodesulfovibrio sp. zrk46 TaxID=2725288 RepID=UPI00144A06AE|nr:isoaspartyl peptidase/L-asparaginase [Pseudodesulfovibrio sp. zrk46]QJB56436.1 hypothetical protein HFN16_08420 [Pseudodesulfovibrio sp. zrk46]